MSAKQPVFQVRDPGYSTVWKSKSSGCLQDMQQAWSTPCPCAYGPALGPQQGQPAPRRSSPGDTALGPSFPSHGVLHAYNPFLDPLRSGCWIQMVCGEKPTARHRRVLGGKN